MNQSASKILREIGLCFIVLVTLTVSIGVSENTDTDKETFKIGIPMKLITNLAPADAAITLRQIVTTSSKLLSEADTVIYKDYQKFLSDIQTGKLGFFSISSLDYLQLKERGVKIEPCLVTVRTGDEPSVRFVVLGKKNNNKSISDYRGKTLIIENRGDFDLREMWLDATLRRDGISEKNKAFFSEIDRVTDAGKAILPVFFGKAHLCLVQRSSWELMSELNPQIANQLEVKEESAPLLEVVNCVAPNTISEKTKTSLEEGLSSLHTTTEGQSLLTIVKLKRFVQFKERYLDGVIALRKEYKTLVQEIPKLSGK